MLSQWLFSLLWLGVVLQRLWEVGLSRRHEARLKEEGAIEHAQAQMPWMIALHAGWLLASLLEVWLLDRRFHAWLGVPALLLFVFGQGLRLVAMYTLGERWTVKVITPIHSQPAVAHGVYRFLRHPNYAGVALEIAALPLVHGAYLTALLFSMLNGLLLQARIAAEERALAATGPYAAQFRGRPRFIPGAWRT